MSSVNDSELNERPISHLGSFAIRHRLAIFPAPVYERRGEPPLFGDTRPHPVSQAHEWSLLIVPTMPARLSVPIT
jgi:hypothetical protein